MATLIKEKQLYLIKNWPGYKLQEGELIGHLLLISTLKILKLISDVNGISEDLIKSDFLTNLKQTFEFLNQDHYKLTTSIIHNLVNGKSNNDDIVNNIACEHFNSSNNLKFIDKFNLLRDFTNKECVIDTLLFLSCLCRKSPKVYSAIHDLNIYGDLKYLIEKDNPSIKSRVCNLIGNLCKHNEYFYVPLAKNGLIGPLINCCYDSDKATRKFACFAIGNAAFQNEKLYEALRPSIPILVKLLDDVEDSTRANAAGAIGNFARNGDALCKDIIQSGAITALLSLTEGEVYQNNYQTIKIALFALGNFCTKAPLVAELEKIDFRPRIEALKLRFHNKNDLIDLLNRILKKLPI